MQRSATNIAERKVIFFLHIGGYKKVSKLILNCFKNTFFCNKVECNVTQQILKLNTILKTYGFNMNNSI